MKKFLVILLSAISTATIVGCGSMSPHQEEDNNRPAERSYRTEVARSQGHASHNQTQQQQEEVHTERVPVKVYADCEVGADGKPVSGTCIPAQAGAKPRDTVFAADKVEVLPPNPSKGVGYDNFPSTSEGKKMCLSALESGNYRYYVPTATNLKGRDLPDGASRQVIRLENDACVYMLTLRGWRWVPQKKGDEYRFNVNGESRVVYARHDCGNPAKEIVYPELKTKTVKGGIEKKYKIFENTTYVERKVEVARPRTGIAGRCITCGERPIYVYEPPRQQSNISIGFYRGFGGYGYGAPGWGDMVFTQNHVIPPGPIHVVPGGLSRGGGLQYSRNHVIPPRPIHVVPGGLSQGGGQVYSVNHVIPPGPITVGPGGWQGGGQTYAVNHVIPPGPITIGPGGWSGGGQVYSVNQVIPPGPITVGPGGWYGGGQHYPPPGGLGVGTYPPQNPGGLGVGTYPPPGGLGVGTYPPPGGLGTGTYPPYNSGGLGVYTGGNLGVNTTPLQ